MKKLKEITNGVAEQPFNKGISVSVNREPNQPPSKNTAGLNRRGLGQNEGVSEILKGWAIQLFSCEHALFFKTSEE